MIIQCENCQAKFRLDDSKIPEKGRKVRLKVGQRADLMTGRIEESYEHREEASRPATSAPEGNPLSTEAAKTDGEARQAPKEQRDTSGAPPAQSVR